MCRCVYVLHYLRICICMHMHVHHKANKDKPGTTTETTQSQDAREALLSSVRARLRVAAEACHQGPRSTMGFEALGFSWCYLKAAEHALVKIWNSSLILQGLWFSRTDTCQHLY